MCQISSAFNYDVRRRCATYEKRRESERERVETSLGVSGSVCESVIKIKVERKFELSLSSQTYEYTRQITIKLKKEKEGNTHVLHLHLEAILGGLRAFSFHLSQLLVGLLQFHVHVVNEMVVVGASGNGRWRVREKWQ